MTFGERVLNRRKEVGLTQEELAKKLGYKSRSSIAKIENGDRDVPRPMIIELAKALNTTPTQLMGWSDEAIETHKFVKSLTDSSNASKQVLDKDAFIDEMIEASNEISSNATMLPDSNVRMIPVYESVSAGFGAHAENMIVDYMPLYIVSAAEAKNTLIIRVEGDSMYPKIEDGDSIQVLKQDFAESGQVAVLLIDGEDAVVKQFFHDPKAKRVTLHSLNPDYMDRVFEGIEITKLRVLGIVKRVIKDI